MFRSSFGAGAGNSDPHNIHEKILQAARRSGVISLNGRGLSYVPPVIWTLNKAPLEEKPISFESAGDDDVKWWEAEPITRLNLFGNSIKELPGDGIAQLDSLVNIDIRDNELVGLPEEIAALVNLKQFLLSYQQITGAAVKEGIAAVVLHPVVNIKFLVTSIDGRSCIAK
ncbi:Leucine-rich repeat-containing protein 40 [Taenia solium]|eukprot:TsM_001027700 transcript=TsM_001027700 gene=TsM_001027700